MPRLVNKQEKIDSILDVSLPLFAQKGFNGTNVAEIAEKAGIGKGTIYEYFESKRDIFKSLIISWIMKINESLSDALKGIEDPEEKLVAIVDWNIDIINKLDSDIPKLFLEIVNQTITKGGVFHDHREFMEEITRGMRNIIRDIILEGVSDGTFIPEVAKDAETISLNLCAYFDGTGIYFLMKKPSIDEQRTMTYHYLEGLLYHMKKRDN